MTDISPHLLLNLLAFLIFPFLGGYICAKLKSSPLIGYIIGGVFLRLIWGESLPKDFIAQFSMLGLVLLVFTLGLETNFMLVKRFGRIVLVGGILQLVISALSIAVLSLAFKFSLLESVFFGIAFAMSSTAIVAKIIQDRGEESSLLGGLTIGILVLQDLSLIPLLIILSSLGRDLSFLQILTNIFVNTLKAGIILAVVYYLGQRIIPLVFNKLAKVSREILNFFIIIFILAALFAFSLLHLSSIITAFLIGVLLGQTLESHHIFSQIRPFRDLLIIVFFVFLGLTIEPLFIAHNFLKILFFTGLVIFTKWFVMLIIALFFKFHSRTAFSLSVFLFEIGEGAFIIVYLGLNKGLISYNNYLFAVTTVLLTLIITPLFIHKRNHLYQSLKTFLGKRMSFLHRYITYRLDREPPNIDVLPLSKHIVICGYGRVGRYIGRALMLANIPFIAVDYSFHTVEKARKEGINIIYGDPTEIDVLDYAEVDAASVLILAVPERYSQEMIILMAKKLNPDIIVFTRVHREDDQIRMKDLGVDVVIQPEFEASLSIVRKILLFKRIPREEIAGKIKRLKIEHGMI